MSDQGYDESKTLSTQQNTEVSVNTPAQIALQEAITAVFGTLGGPVLHNFQGNDIEIWKQTSVATGPDVKGIDDFPAEGIDMVHFYVHPVELDGPTEGEVVEAIRSVLIDKDGNAYGFVSNFLARDLAKMIAVFGLEPWNPPVRIKVRKNKAKQKGHFYTIVPA